MKRAVQFLVCIFAALSVLTGTAARASYEDVFHTGIWRGYAFYDEESGDFRHCGAAQDDGSSIIIFAIRADLTLAVMLQDTTWQLGRGRDYTVTMQVDSRQARTVTGWGEDDQIAFNLGFDYDFLDDLRGGYTLYVRGARTLEYSLKGTSVALRKVAQCALEHTEVAENSNPFGNGSARNPFGEGDGEAGVLTADEAADLKVVLIAAGLENVQIQTGAHVQERMGANTLAAWTAGGDVVGFYYYESYDRTAEPRLMMSYLMGELGSECEGQLAIAQDEPVQAPDETLIRGSAACVADTETYFYDALVSFGGDYIYMIAHVSDEASHAHVTSVTQELVSLFSE